MINVTRTQISVAKLARVFNPSDVATFYQIRLDGVLYTVSAIEIKGHKFLIDATKDGNGTKKSITLEGTDLVIKNVRDLEVVHVGNDRNIEVESEVKPKSKAEVKEQVVVDADKNPDINYALVESLAKQLSVVDKQKLAIALLSDVQASLEPTKTAKTEVTKTPAKTSAKAEPPKAKTTKTEPAKAEKAKADSKPYETQWKLLCDIAADKKAGTSVEQLADKYNLGTATINEEQNTYRWLTSLDKSIAKQILNAWKGKKVTFSTINNCVKAVKKHDLESAIDCCLGKIDFKTAKANAEAAKSAAV